MAVTPPLVVATSSPSPPTVEAPPLHLHLGHWDNGSTGPSPDSRYAGEAKRLFKKYKDVVGPSKKLPPLKHVVEHDIETTPARLVVPGTTDWTLSG